jgi:hypothetical protein
MLNGQSRDLMIHLNITHGSFSLQNDHTFEHSNYSVKI